jgi:mRNA-degrading endonuclease RelE of RelBE toxin-antitoxin system
MKELIYFDEAINDLNDLPLQVRKPIIQKLDKYAAGGSADITKLVDRNEYRLRVGDYRVLLFINDDNIEVLAASHRKDAY